ncbi:TlpA family protein disulfide reductase [Aromatoleum sp.]|uniref:TlpA family protein disulfide reductase n=1 Tax=Aromatoleum sp. TaxID=2307007 RepID=UPI002FC7293C
MRLGISGTPPRKRPWLPKGLVALGLALALIAPLPARSREPASMPAVPLTRLDGTAMRATDWLGRPLVVNIWATWCPPCRTEMPSLQRLSALIEPSGARVVALSLDTDLNLVREFVLKYGIALPIGVATTPGSATDALGATALPLTLYVAPDGRIVGRHFGQRNWAEESAVRDVKQRLLAR